MPRSKPSYNGKSFVQNRTETPYPWRFFSARRVMAGGSFQPHGLLSIDRVAKEGASQACMDFDANLWLSCNKSGLGKPLGELTRRNLTISASDSEMARRESGSAFMPKYDSSGLLTAVVTHVDSGEVLMVAFMDAEALAMTRETGFAHFHSRSKGRLWKKGETSGHVLKVEEVLVDCDQDALVIKATPAGPACHTGEPSCFYRRLDGDQLDRLES